MCKVDENYKSEEQLIDEETTISVEDRLRRLEKRAVCFDKKLSKIISLLETAAEHEAADHRARVAHAVQKLWDAP